jgi:YD repeat-containing protein
MALKGRQRRRFLSAVVCGLPVRAEREARIRSASRRGEAAGSVTPHGLAGGTPPAAVSDLLAAVATFTYEATGSPPWVLQLRDRLAPAVPEPAAFLATTMTYDAGGEATSLRDSAGFTTTYCYDSRGSR